jgi:hypothetical protein
LVEECRIEVERKAELYRLVIIPVGAVTVYERVGDSRHDALRRKEQTEDAGRNGCMAETAAP